VSLGESDMGTRQALLALLLFVCWGSLTIAAPVFYRVIAGKAADRRLHEWQNWLMHNNTTVMFVLLLLVGALLIGKGLGALVQGNTNYA
jgi:hypothetical protein